MFALPAAMKSGANLAYKRAGGGTQVPPPLSRGATGEEAAPMDNATNQTVWFFCTYTGKLSVPDSFLPAVIFTFLSVTTQSS